MYNAFDIFTTFRCGDTRSSSSTDSIVSIELVGLVLRSKTRPQHWILLYRVYLLLRYNFRRLKEFTPSAPLDRNPCVVVTHVCIFFRRFSIHIDVPPLSNKFVERSFGGYGARTFEMC